jgi:hypothetical protein
MKYDIKCCARQVVSSWSAVPKAYRIRRIDLQWKTAHLRAIRLSNPV